MIGPSRKLQRGPPAFWARSRANVRTLLPLAQDVVLLGDQIGLRFDGVEHAAPGRDVGGFRARRAAGAPLRGSEYPTRDATTAGGAPAPPFAFAAAFLSLIFPGLGHAYAGAYTRALGFAAVPVLLVALAAGFGLRMDRNDLIGLVLNPFFLQSVFVVNLLFLAYRVVAIVDAYRVAEFLNRHEASGDGRLGPARLIRNPLSIAGLLAVILVMSGVHVVVARYDALALDALTGGCIFVGDARPIAPTRMPPRPPTRPRASPARPSRPRRQRPSPRRSAATCPRSPSRRGTARSA